MLMELNQTSGKALKLKGKKFWRKLFNGIVRKFLKRTNLQLTQEMLLFICFITEYLKIQVLKIIKLYNKKSMIEWKLTQFLLLHCSGCLRLIVPGDIKFGIKCGYIIKMPQLRLFHILLTSKVISNKSEVPFITFRLLLSKLNHLITLCLQSSRLLLLHESNFCLGRSKSPLEFWTQGGILEEGYRSSDANK